MEQEIVDYISQAQKHGLTDFEIKQNLLSAGWEAGVVEKNFVFAKAAQNQPSATQAPAISSGLPQAHNAIAPHLATLQSQPNITIDDNHFSAGPKRPMNKKAIALIVVLLLLLAGGAFAYYTFVYSNPVKVWEKFLKTEKDLVYQTKFSFSYSDPGEIADDAGIPGFQLKDIKLKFDGSGYVNTQNAEDPQASSKVQYTFSSGNTSFSTGFEYILVNQIFYLNIGDNPFLNALGASAAGGKKVDWIKVDLKEAQKQSSSMQRESEFFTKLSDPAFKSQLEKIWSDASLIKQDKYLGREKINGKTTLHFKNSLDKQALKGVVDQYVQLLSREFKDSNGYEAKPEDVNLINEIAGQLIDKIEIKEFETWVGLSDFHLYKVHLVTNAPSVISLVKQLMSAGPLSVAREKSRDAKRLADMRQMASAFELYYNDYNGYPEAAAGKPVDISPTYIGMVPTTATPADGTCTDFYNGYWYKPMGKKKVVNGKTLYDSYQMTFCLGADAAGYKAGIAKLTPQGITSGIACPTTPEQCAKVDTSTVTEDVKQQVRDFISKLDFSATILTDADYSDYGKKVDLTPPADALDILKMSGGTAPTEEKSADAQRIYDIRQFASANELYFNDKSSYPADLS